MALNHVSLCVCVCRSSPAATSVQEEVLPWWGRPKGQRHCPLFHAHCSCPPDVCQQHACACFWVGVCRRAKIVLKNKWFVLVFHYCCPGDGMKTAKACFFPHIHSLHLKGVSVSFNSVVTDQSQTLVPDREWWPHHCSLWTSCPSSSGFFHLRGICVL